MKRLFLAAFIIAILLVSGCGEPTLYIKPYYYVKSQNGDYCVNVTASSQHNESLHDIYVKCNMSARDALALADKLNKEYDQDVKPDALSSVR